MIKVSDFIVSYLSDKYGIDTVFMVTGGGAMHLNDSFGRHPRMKVIFNHHEQACAIAAEGYVRSCGRMCVVNVTTGPGGLNTLTGLMGQWTDSVPVIYISGQVRFDTTIGSCPDIGLRQLGDQEVDITRIVRPLVKYVAVVKNPIKIRSEIDQAMSAATTERPGPVWLDVPMNVQGDIIEENSLVGFNSPRKERPTCDTMLLRKLLDKSVRPVLIAGHGIRLAGAIVKLKEIIRLLNIPIVTTFNGFDLVESDNPHFIGRVGTVGDRAGNFAVQNSDLLLCVGTRNNIRQVGYNFDTFAREATKVIVDIDPAEMEKPTLRPNVRLLMDAGVFLGVLSEAGENLHTGRWSEWLQWCRERRAKYPVVLPEYRTAQELNPYLFIEELTQRLSPSHIMIAGNGSACVCLFQAGIVKEGQRAIWNSGCAAMGYDLPAAIGAAIANPDRPVVCLAGDGSIQMNLQELATVARNKLDVKLFVLNNGGYVSIRQTQLSFFGPPLIGCDETSGLMFPDLCALAQAYGIPYCMIDKQNLQDLDQLLKKKGPVLINVVLQKDYRFSPKSASETRPDGKIVSKPLEDLSPFLERSEFLRNMIIPTLKD